MLIYKKSFVSFVFLTSLLATTNGFAMDVKDEISTGHIRTFQPKDKECDDQVGSTEIASITTDDQTANRDSARNLELMNLIPCDVWRMFFKVWSENGIDPRIVERSFKAWNKSMRLGPKSDNAGIPYTTKKNHYFMEDCMRSFLKAKIIRGSLSFDKTSVSVLRLNEFPLCLPLNGTKLKLYDRQERTYEFKNQVITFSADRFKENGGRNSGKLVTLICPVDMAKQLCPFGNLTAATTSYALVWKWSKEDAHAYHLINLDKEFKEDAREDLYGYYRKAVNEIPEYKEWGQNLMWVRLEF